MEKELEIILAPIPEILVIAALARVANLNREEATKIVEDNPRKGMTQLIELLNGKRV